MNDLLEKMKDDFETFCCSAQQFMDAVREQNAPKVETPDYKSWIGKVVYVWDYSFSEKQKAVLLNYIPDSIFPFRIASNGFKHAELCEDE